MTTPKDYVKDTKRRDAMVDLREETGSYDSSIDKWAYQYFGDVFNDREELLEDYQTTLKAAHIPVGSDLYLGKTVFYTLAVTVSMLVLNALVSVTLFATGLSAEIFGSLIFEMLFLLGYPVIISIIAGGGTAVVHYALPKFKANRRASRIDAGLPSAVTFMYALNRGGMNLVQVMRTLAKNEEVYGEVSKEVGTIIQDMEFFSRDMMEAFRRSAERTPSQKFSDLMDDTVATIDSGASTAPFLEDKSEELIEEAERDQENFIETLSLLGEVYVTAFVAGPLFMIIITVIMAMMGGANPTQLDGIVYGLLPFMNVGYFFLINVLSGADPKQAKTVPKEENYNRKSDVDDLEKFAEDASDDRVKKVYEAKRKRERTALIREPIRELLREPNQTMYFTAPLALIFLVLVPILGLAEPSLQAFIDSPVPQTLMWGLVPIFIIAVPLSVTFEISARREKKMMGRLPEALKQLASANSVGMTLTEAMQTTAENTSGRLGDEFKSVKNDVQWNHDINSAMIDLANRVQIPILSRTAKLITEANSSTGDIENVLAVAAKNVKTQVRLKKERKAAMMMYTAVILVSFCVYMFVVALLDVMFLSTIAEIDTDGLSGGGGGGGGGEGGGGGFSVSDLPINRFRMVFYHSTIVQAFGSGMIAGYLASEDIRSGLKFAIVLTIISSGIFYYL